MVLYHMRYDLSFGDAVDYFALVLQRRNWRFPSDGTVWDVVRNFTVFHYLNWSSRSLIELVLIVVSILPALCWHVLDILAVLCIGYCMERLVRIQDGRIKYLSIFSFLMTYQIMSMSSAGWIATTINYS